MRSFLLSALLLTFTIPSAVFSQSTQPFSLENAYYLWPNSASHYLTSTFAETRSGHFHAALDLKTWGRRGYKVFATRDGIVHRIAIGPTGYGKVVYLKHPDGSFSVYAHLMAFNDELQQLADSIRFADNYKFEIDRFIRVREIKVEQGDVIGISGASGIGPPHLHFELRTPNHKPFNPLLTNLTVKDNIAPQIQGISIEPLAAHSTIEGANKIFTKSTRELNEVEVSGPVGLGVKVFDQSNNVHNVYAVYELSLSVDGQDFFSSRVDSFSYHETEQMFIDRVYPLLNKHSATYQRLFIADGNSLPFYKTRANNGALDLSPGTHRITVRATDYYGNSSTSTFQLTVNESQVRHPRLTYPSNKKSESFILPWQWNWHDNWFTLSKDSFQGLTIASTDNSQFLQYEDRIGVKLKDRLFMNIPKIGPVKFHRLAPETGGIITSTSLEDFAAFPKNIFYDTLSVGMTVHKFKKDSIRVDVIPEAFPIRGAYKIYVTKDSTFTDTGNLSFYQWDRDDLEWEMIPTDFRSNYIVAEAESLGSFTSLRDSTAPVLENPRLAQRPDGQWLVMVGVTDNLSDVDYKRTEMWVNGNRGIAEFEPEDDCFVYYHPEFIPSDKMEIKVIAFDRMGNRKEKKFYINHQEIYTN